MSPLTVQGAVDAIDLSAIDQAQHLAADTGITLEEAWALIAAEFSRRARTRSAATLAGDGRATKWRARCRLYNMNRPDEPEADSDPDRPADSQGETVLGGLPAVAEWLSRMATIYHADVVVSGLDMPTLRHSLKSLRPTLSRRGGNATWRVPYTAGDVAWKARIDVVREPTTET